MKWSLKNFYSNIRIRIKVFTTNRETFLRELEESLPDLVGVGYKGELIITGKLKPSPLDSPIEAWRKLMGFDVKVTKIKK